MEETQGKNTKSSRSLARMWDEEMQGSVVSVREPGWGEGKPKPLDVDHRRRIALPKMGNE